MRPFHSVVAAVFAIPCATAIVLAQRTDVFVESGPGADDTGVLVVEA